MNSRIAITYLGLVASACASDHYVSGSKTPSELCGSLEKIKVLPYKQELPSDPYYNAVIEQGCAATECLVARITDESLMRDPRTSPKYDDFRTGDLAVFLLSRITRQPFEAFLPAEVRAKVADEGVYAYFDFVKTPSARKTLQDKWRAYLAQHPCVQNSGTGFQMRRDATSSPLNLKPG